MSDNNLLRRLLIDEEGCKLEAYKDSEKKLWHIGIGHNLEMEQTDEELSVLGIFDEDDPGSLTISEQQAYTLFDIDVQDAIDDVYPAFTEEDLEKVGETRRAVILSMCFQMGGGGVRKYKDFKKAVIDGDWEKAAHEMVTGSRGGPSRWLIQTPDRCQRAADAMEVGYFKQYQETSIEQRPDQIDTPLAGMTDQELLNQLNEITQELTRRLGITT